MNSPNFNAMTQSEQLRYTCEYYSDVGMRGVPATEHEVNTMLQRVFDPLCVVAKINESINKQKIDVPNCPEIFNAFDRIKPTGYPFWYTQ